jgi:hypothetical protein
MYWLWLSLTQYTYAGMQDSIQPHVQEKIAQHSTSHWCPSLSCWDLGVPLVVPLEVLIPFSFSSFLLSLEVMMPSI